MPSFGRTLGLPSAWSIPTHALRRGCDPMNVHGAVRPAIASSSRAPAPVSTFRCPPRRDCHPRPEPRRPIRCATPVQGRRDRAPPQRTFIRGNGVSNGLLWACGCLPISATHIDARARPRAVNPPPREAPASVRVRGDLRHPTPFEGDPSPRSPATDVSIRRELCAVVPRAVASHRPATGTTGIHSGREMTPRNHAV